MKKIIIIITAVAMFAACTNSTAPTHEHSHAVMQSDSTQTAVAYQCPMDCEKGKMYNKPGKCPVCGMDLEKKK